MESPDTAALARLVGRLNHGLDRRLTLVCAPAGHGKTTLLGIVAILTPLLTVIAATNGA